MRRDTTLIKAIYRELGKEEVDRYLAKPFFDVADTFDKQLAKDGKDSSLSLAPEYIPVWTDFSEVLGLLPFESFNIFIPNVGLYTINEVYVNKGQYYVDVTNYVDADAHKRTGIAIGSKLRSLVTIKPNILSSSVGIALLYLTVDDEDVPISQLDSVPDQFAKSIVANFEYILAYFKFVQSTDLYMVERSKPTTIRDLRAAKKKPWTRKDLPSIVYLNQMPSEKKESQGGTHASPKAHQRRGHWRKLEHERFKNHPKFGQKIRVKPSWVGNKEEIVNGTIYRLKEDS